ncbi:hypothetical protein K439DRAFT_1638040, partial [Ramaria rubella]
ITILRRRQVTTRTEAEYTRSAAGACSWPPCGYVPVIVTHKPPPCLATQPRPSPSSCHSYGILLRFHDDYTRTLLLAHTDIRHCVSCAESP